VSSFKGLCKGNETRAEIFHWKCTALIKYFNRNERKACLPAGIVAKIAKHLSLRAFVQSLCKSNETRAEIFIENRVPPETRLWQKNH
jgi:hypothetical protein